MRVREDADRFTLEHFGSQGWQVLSEVRSMDAAMLKARSLFQDNPAIHLRIAVHSPSAKKIYPLRAPRVEAAAARTHSGPDLSHIKQVTDRLLMIAAGGIAIVILGVLVLQAVSMLATPS